MGQSWGVLGDFVDFADFILLFAATAFFGLKAKEYVDTLIHILRFFLACVEPNKVYKVYKVYTYTPHD